MICSIDGFNWVPAVASSLFVGGGCNDLAWNGQIWIAVGKSITQRSGPTYTDTFYDTILTSYNGFIWAQIPEPPFQITAAGEAHSIVWNGNIWIATGSDVLNGLKTIYWSRDGIIWTLVSGVTFNTNTGITYGRRASRVISSGGTLFAIGTSYNGTTSKARILYSREGHLWFETWQYPPPPDPVDPSYIPDNVELLDLTYNGFFWVAVGRNSTFPYILFAAEIAAESWNAGDVTGITGSITSIIFTGLYTIIGTNTGTHYYNKLFGIQGDWIQLTLPISEIKDFGIEKIPAYIITSQPNELTESTIVAGGDSAIVPGGTKSFPIITSLDRGLTWIPGRNATPTSLSNVIFGDSNNQSTSLDNVYNTGRACNSVAWNGNIWVAVGDAGIQNTTGGPTGATGPPYMYNSIYTSSDSYNWSAIPLKYSSGSLDTAYNSSFQNTGRKVVWGSSMGLFAAVGDNLLLISFDGVWWQNTGAIVDTDVVPMTICYGINIADFNYYFVAVSHENITNRIIPYYLTSSSADNGVTLPGTFSNSNINIINHQNVFFISAKDSTGTTSRIIFTSDITSDLDNYVSLALTNSTITSMASNGQVIVIVGQFTGSPTTSIRVLRFNPTDMTLTLLTNPIKLQFTDTGRYVTWNGSFWIAIGQNTGGLPYTLISYDPLARTWVYPRRDLPLLTVIQSMASRKNF
jgi:hypothetical protein